MVQEKPVLECRVQDFDIGEKYSKLVHKFGHGGGRLMLDFVHKNARFQTWFRKSQF